MKGFIIIIIFFNIVLMWTIVGAPKGSILYVYIDYYCYHILGFFFFSYNFF